MKEQAIQKINKVGKVSSIIAAICKVAVILGIIINIIVVVVLMMIPETALKITKSGTMKIEMNFADAGILVSENEPEDLQMDVTEDGGLMEKIWGELVNGQHGVAAEGQAYIPTDVVVTEDGTKIEMASGEMVYTMKDMVFWVSAFFITLIPTLITLIFMEGLCKAFRDCASPFEENVIKRMQRLAIALIPWTIISTWMDSIQRSVMSGARNWSISVDLGVVLIVLVVLILVYIFKYGAVLQQESDETL